jgi:integrase
MDIGRRRGGSFSIVQLTLQTGENLPVLVRRPDWVPLRVPTRWAVRHRRFACMENTLARDLRNIGLLYQWAEESLRLDLDDLLEHSQIPCGRQLESLVAFLRRGTASIPSNSVDSLATVAVKALSIRSFLMWASDPTNQGHDRRKTMQQLAEERAMLSAMFRPLERYTASVERIRPLSQQEVDEVDRLFGPVRDEERRIILPVRFAAHNPFRPGTRLRNWLMMAISMQCGHRRGELLKTRLDDIPRSTDVGLKIRRRPHDPADSRRYKPRAKTVERTIPVSPEVRVGLRAYLATPAPIGRPTGRSPYLFVSDEGVPLSISGADGILHVVSRHTGINDLSWHSFRHTWAEGLADDLLNQHPEDQALQIIRDLGGWKRGSTVPMHYIQNALRKRGIEFLRERNSRLYTAPETQ